MAIDWLEGGAPRIAIMGDSWLGGEPNIAAALGTALGGSVIANPSVSSTGYVRAVDPRVPYTDPARIKELTDANTNLIILFGSVNDHFPINEDGQKGDRVEAAAKQVIAEIRKVKPKVPIVVTGQQVSSAYRNRAPQTVANNVALYNAATQSGPGIAWVDQIGINGGVPTQFSAGATYNEGQIIWYLGANYRVTRQWATGSDTPDTPGAPVEMVSLLLKGMGHVGDKKGDGNRDEYLTTDQTHLTNAGIEPYSKALAALIEKALEPLKDWVSPPPPPAPKDPPRPPETPSGAMASIKGASSLKEGHVIMVSALEQRVFVFDVTKPVDLEVPEGNYSIAPTHWVGEAQVRFVKGVVHPDNLLAQPPLGGRNPKRGSWFEAPYKFLANMGSWLASNGFASAAAEMRKGVELGANGIELSVYRTSDGRLFVSNIKESKTAGKTFGPDSTLAQLKALNPSNPMLTLSEALRVAKELEVAVLVRPVDYLTVNAESEDANRMYADAAEAVKNVFGSAHKDSVAFVWDRRNPYTRRAEVEKVLTDPNFAVLVDNDAGVKVYNKRRGDILILLNQWTTDVAAARARYELPLIRIEVSQTAHRDDSKYDGYTVIDTAQFKDIKKREG